MSENLSFVANPMKSGGDVEMEMHNSELIVCGSEIDDSKCGDSGVVVGLRHHQHECDDKMMTQERITSHRKIKRISAVDISLYHVYTSKPFLDELLTCPQRSKQNKVLLWLFLSTFVLAREQCFEKKRNYYLTVLFQVVTLIASFYSFIISVFIMGGFCYLKGE